MKFDRITYGYCLSNIQQTETFFGDSSRTSFPLIWKPDNTKGNSTVTVDGRILLSYEYTLDSDLNEIIFNNPINDNIPIIVTYRKDITVFNAVDRINFFYDPQIGDLGNDHITLLEPVVDHCDIRQVLCPFGTVYVTLVTIIQIVIARNKVKVFKCRRKFL